MTAEAYPLHHRSEAVVAADPQRLFAHLDDPQRLANDAAAAFGRLSDVKP